MRPHRQDRRRLTAWMLAPALFAWAVCAGRSGPAAAVEAPAGVKFVPFAEARPVTVELRSEARVQGPEVRLRQVARWTEAEDGMLAGAGEVIVARFSGGDTTLSIDAAGIRTTLESAGLNAGALHFSGAASCRVTRSDPRLPGILEQAATAAAARIARQMPACPQTRRSGSGGSTPVDPPPQTTRTLREILIEELAGRFNIPAEALDVRFSSADQHLVNLCEPLFRFEVEPRRQRNLGDITWDVTIISDGGQKKATVTASVRAWQTQLVAARPIAFRQVLREEDIIERRVLVDRLGDEMPLERQQAVGQQAARDISAGAVITSRMIEAPQMVRVGELITVLVSVGKVQLKWVAEARENGARGQTIRVRKPHTREEFSVVVTGPQEGKLVGGYSNGVAAAAP